MDEFERLLKAAIEGKAEEMERLADEVNPEVLCGTTEAGNTCLHIASICGHKDFCTKLLTRLPSITSSSLLSVTNKDGETPLLIAVKSGRPSLALGLLEKYSKHGLKQDILKQDRHGCNVLHHAIRNGYEDLALRLIDQQPALSESCNNRRESPMFIAVLKGFKRVYIKLLNNEKSEYSGAMGYNALHAAVKYGNEDFVEKLVNKHSEKVKNLARQEDRKRDCPMQLTAHFNRDKILQIMLKCDRSLGYAISTNGNPLLFTAASRGHAAFARALVEHCPDAPYHNNEGRTCLHEAVDKDKKEFVQFILEKNSKLRKLVNMLDNDGDSALHLAVRRSDPKMVRALLAHPDIDITAVNNTYTSTAIWKLYEFEDYAKTINWNKICWLILNADPRAETDIYNLHEEIRNKVIDASRKDAKSLIETYTGNTSLVAILIATITFAAAFTLPGGYSSDAGSEGLPIMARKLAFQAFLIFDTLAMCSSLVVAFICVIARWMDFEFLLHYRFFTKKFMWFAYMATTLAFATGLYTVLADRLHWLAIAICVLSVLLPILTMLIGEWPILKLKFRYSKPFDSNFLDMVCPHTNMPDWFDMMDKDSSYISLSNPKAGMYFLSVPNNFLYHSFNKPMCLIVIFNNNW